MGRDGRPGTAGVKGHGVGAQRSCFLLPSSKLEHAGHLQSLLCMLNMSPGVERDTLVLATGRKECSRKRRGPVHFIAMFSQPLHLDEPQTNSGPPQLEMEEAVVRKE